MRDGEVGPPPSADGPADDLGGTLGAGPPRASGDHCIRDGEVGPPPSADSPADELGGHTLIGL